MRSKGQQGARSDGLGFWGEEEQAHIFPGVSAVVILRRWGRWTPSILQNPGERCQQLGPRAGAVLALVRSEFTGIPTEGRCARRRGGCSPVMTLAHASLSSRGPLLRPPPVPSAHRTSTQLNPLPKCSVLIVSQYPSIATCVTKHQLTEPITLSVIEKYLSVTTSCIKTSIDVKKVMSSPAVKRRRIFLQREWMRPGPGRPDTPGHRPRAAACRSRCP